MTFADDKLNMLNDKIMVKLVGKGEIAVIYPLSTMFSRACFLKVFIM